jgi:hypothetical protein
MTIMSIDELRAAMPRRGRRPPPPTTRTATAAPDPRRILGLDLAMGTTGWALLNRGWPEAHGSFALPDRRRGEPLAAWLTRRAAEMARQLDVLLYAQAPEAVGYEFPDGPRPSWSGGSKGREFNAVQGLSRAEGMLVALWPTCGRGLPLVSVPASEMRRIVTGQVNANKQQVAWALATYRRWDVRGWTEDEVDAGGIALATPEVMG